jgi:hypothetical protein
LTPFELCCGDASPKFQWRRAGERDLMQARRDPLELRADRVT